jgi:hypothetical protein
MQPYVQELLGMNTNSFMNTHEFNIIYLNILIKKFIYIIYSYITKNLKRLSFTDYSMQLNLL